jgi:hypothetical protein
MTKVGLKPSASCLLRKVRPALAIQPAFNSAMLSDNGPYCGQQEASAIPPTQGIARLDACEKFMHNKRSRQHSLPVGGDGGHSIVAQADGVRLLYRVTGPKGKRISVDEFVRGA